MEDDEVGDDGDEAGVDGLEYQMTRATDDDDLTSCTPVPRMSHPFRDFRARKRSNRLSTEQQLEICIQYLEKTENRCRLWSGPRKNSSPFSKCRCIGWLSDAEKSDEREGVATYMMNFFDKTKEERQRLLIEWIRYTQNQVHPRRFFIPVTDRVPVVIDGGEEEKELAKQYTVKIGALRAHLICRSALGFILDISKDAWSTCAKAVKLNIIPQHGNKYCRSGKGKQFDKNIKPDLDRHMKHIQRLAEPQSTRAVRDAVGALTLKDKEDDVLYLPTHLSKRQIYEDFCLKRGHCMLITAKGYVSQNPPTTAKSIPAWSTFLLSYWKREWPKLRLGKPSEDVCNLCHTFHQRFKYRSLTKNKDAMDELDDSEEVGLGTFYSSPGLTVPSPEKRKGTTTVPQQLPSPVEVAPITGTRAYHGFCLEAIETEFGEALKEAQLHVLQEAGQRQLCNKKIDEAEWDYANPKHHEDTKRCIVMDFSQNISLPQVGASQPGKTYYMSPLRVFVFGIVNCGPPGGELYSYVYHEGQAHKGGDNVASMMMLFLEEMDWLGDPSADGYKKGKELTIIMDNCAGQNKNNTVLRLANLIVEAGYFETVNMIFYVVGHTKNACDRWFNTLKARYSHSNLWTMNQVLNSLRTHKRIHVSEIKKGDMKRWEKWLNKYYRRIETGKTSSGHIFTATAGATSLTIKTDNLGTHPIHVQEMKKRVATIDSDERLKLLQTREGIEPCPTPGISGIKQIELYKKWRSIVPPQYWHLTCPKPSPEVFATELQRQRVSREKFFEKSNKRKGILAKPTRGRGRPKKKKPLPSSELKAPPPEAARSPSIGTIDTNSTNVDDIDEIGGLKLASL